MRIERIGDAVLYNGDCLEVMATLDGYEAIITDPPYGIGMDGGNVGYKGFNDFEKKNWDTEVPVDAIAFILSKGLPTIMWGGNYFNVPPSRCWLIWDKGAGFKGRTYAEAELAWTSIDANVRIFARDPLARGDYKGKANPTQKPTPLMKWCIGHVSPAKIILDPFMGSGSTGVAAVEMGQPFVGIERDPGYFDVACERIRKAYDQGDMFLARPITLTPANDNRPADLFGATA